MPAGGTAPALSAAAWLASPAALAELLPAGPGRSASYVPSDLLRAGPDYAPMLPQHRASLTAGNTRLYFRATGSALSDGLDQCAYACYSFEPGDYAGDPSINFEFEESPGAAAAFCLLADWEGGRWESHGISSAGVCTLDDLGRHIDAEGRLLLCLLLFQGDTTLTQVRIGSPAPLPQLTAQPLLARVPVTVHFDASASTDEGSIAEYLWDPEGDGSFVSGGSAAQFDFEYTQTGDFEAVLRVVDDSGIYNTTSVLIRARDYELHSFGTSAQQYACRILPAGAGNVILCGASQTGAGYAPLLAVCDPLAPEVQAFVKQLPGSFEARDAVIGPDGAVYLCGDLLRSGGEMNAVLQKWSPDGSLVWSREYGSATDDEAFRGIVASSDSVYVAGEVLPQGGGLQGLLAKISLDGSQQWVSVLNEPANSVLYDLAWLEPQQVGEAALQACGGFTAAGDPQALYCSFDASGALLQTLELGSATTTETAFGLVAAGSAAMPELSIAGTGSTAETAFGFISRPGAAGSRIDLAGADSVNLCCLRGLTDGSLALSLSAPDFETARTRNLLLRLDKGSFGLSSAREMSFGLTELLFGADLLELPDGQLCPGAGAGGALPELQPAMPATAPLGLDWQALSATASAHSALEQGLHGGPAAMLDNGSYDREVDGDSDLLFGVLGL